METFKGVPLHYGDIFHEAVAKVVNPNAQPSEHRLTRTAGRYLEEGVELALACGLSAAEILVHITDALHNEARKANRFPSGFTGFDVPSANAPNITVELSDTQILHDYIRFLANIEPVRVTSAIMDKIDLLHHRAVAGELVEHDELIYKASLNR